MIVAVPLPLAVILPLWLTVATLAFEVVHFSFLFVAFVGETFALIVVFLPLINVTDFLVNFTFETFFTTGFVVVGIVDGIVLTVVGSVSETVVGSLVVVVGSVSETVVGSLVVVVGSVSETVVGSLVVVVGSVSETVVGSLVVVVG